MYTHSMILKMVRNLEKYRPISNDMSIKLLYLNNTYYEFAYSPTLSMWYTIYSYYRIDNVIFKTTSVLDYYIIGKNPALVYIPEAM